MPSSGGFTHFRAKVLVAFVAMFAISWFSILAASYINLDEKRREEQQELRQQFLNLYEQELTNYRNAFMASLDELTHPSRVAHSFSLSNKPFFLSNFAADFANLNQRLSISHMYFSTASRYNIARLHAPERSEDQINRVTTLRAAQTRDFAYGIETGYFGSLTFRVVKPIYGNETLRGFAELGRELDGIWELATKQLDVSLMVIVDKAVLSEEGWREGKEVFGYPGDWETHNTFVEHYRKFQTRELSSAMAEIVKEENTEETGQVVVNDQIFLYTKVPLTDVSENRIGSIVLAYPQTQLAGDLFEELGGAASASAVALLVGLIVCYLLLSPVARNIQNRQVELEREIDHRTKALSIAKEEALEARDRAEIANKAKSEFLSNMSHELRTPLNSIIGFSSIVKNDELHEGIGEKYQSYVEVIHNSGTHLLAIINDILDVSRIEAGELEMRFQEISLKRLFEECHQMVNVRATDRYVAILHDNFEEDIEIEADPTRLKQILLNLLSNAIKFTEPPGVIRFWAERADEKTVRIIVEDEGCGVPVEELPVVLRRFGKAASSVFAKQSEDGVGLGLTLVQDLVKQHGGKFHFESAPNKGTRVTISLPLFQDETGASDLI